MKIAIVGEGGHSKVIQDLISLLNGYEIVGIFDDKYNELELKEKHYIGPIKAINQFCSFFIDTKVIVAIGDNRIRKSIVSRLSLSGSTYITLIHPSAIVSQKATLGIGTVVMANAVINSDTYVGDHSIINTGAIVEHDNNIGDFAHISPNATLTGSVQVGDGTHIGAGATVIPNLTIGAWAKVGAGATVIHDIPDFSTAVGVPGKIVTKKMEV
ncbi:acetyltransferase [Litchfieldia salsa]|uniref:Acetyltransferase EpsM n=1 Tax=Litchfieldia salsa TaxID=930152 RepID=A0A1H0VEM3_9BACI|nr:acetyltransferase [Litchfieldia salsa]SDP76773.1 acetyltransferase EpsM [Litchfieldia salsa]